MVEQLEQVVRPFQTPDTIRDKATLVTTVTKKVTSRAVLVWGAAGKQPEAKSTGISFKVKDPFQFEEFERSTTDVRIENPDDSSQYIIAQRIDSISFKKKKTSDGGSSASGSSSGTKETVSADGSSTFDTESGSDDTTTVDPAGGSSTTVKVSDVASETVLRGASTATKPEKDTFKLTKPTT